MSRPAWLLALAWVAGFTLIDSSIVSLALPAIAAHFDRSVAEVAWVATGFLMALAAALIPAGRLLDPLGARRVMLGGSALFNSLRQLGAAFGAALPAVAFEFVAHGSRVTDAALAGSSAAFLLRAVVLAVPFGIVLVRWQRRALTPAASTA